MSERKLTTSDVQGLAMVLDAAGRSARVARAIDNGAVVYGTARTIGDNYGAATPEVDFRDRYLWVTTTGGMEVFWPVSTLAREALTGLFVVDYDERLTDSQHRYTLAEIRQGTGFPSGARFVMEA
jgi:hypothetical protein